jgi:hypothetical protein
MSRVKTSPYGILVEGNVKIQDVTLRVPLVEGNVKIQDVTLRVPSGRSKLQSSDLNPSHLDRLRDWVVNGRAAYIFIPPGAGRLLKRTPQFFWLPAGPISHDGSLPILFRSNQKVVYAPYHFSCVGVSCLKKDRDQQIRDIGELVKSSILCHSSVSVPML